MNGGEEERRGKKQDREELLFISHFGSSVGVLSANIIFIQFLTLGPSVSYKVGQKGLFGFLCYVAREIPNELFGQCNILPRMMEKQGEDRSGDGDL